MHGSVLGKGKMASYLRTRGSISESFLWQEVSIGSRQDGWIDGCGHSGMVEPEKTLGLEDCSLQARSWWAFRRGGGRRLQFAEANVSFLFLEPHLGNCCWYIYVHLILRFGGLRVSFCYFRLVKQCFYSRKRNVNNEFSTLALQTISILGLYKWPKSKVG